MTIQVSGLYVYPLKSARGISLRQASIGKMGIVYDRQWMVVDENGMFVAQRSDRGLGVGVRSMCLIRPSFFGTNLVLQAPKMPKLKLPLAGYVGPRVTVQVWESQLEGTYQGDLAAEWITTYLSQERQGNYRIVRMPDAGVRKTKRGEGQLAFADGYPFLVVSEESLHDLNSRMGKPLPMDRFRPNIVLKGCVPYAEDRMKRVSIGYLHFEGVKLCVRCPITTFDQLKIERGKEPLKTLATYRRTPKGVVFAKNFNNMGVGKIAVGDEVSVLNWEEVEL